MPRGGARIGAGRPKAPGQPPTSKALPIDPVKAETKAAAMESELTPLAYMVAVMNDPGADDLRRDRMAVAAAPYLHPKQGESGKKDEKRSAAKTAGGGKFAPAAPPRLVSSR